MHVFLQSFGTPFALIAAFAFTAIASPYLQAQEDLEPRWYQVEIAIFTQPGNAQLAANAEIFRKDVTLSYGKNARHLRDLMDVAREMAEQNLQDDMIAGLASQPAPAAEGGATGATPQSEPIPLSGAEIAAVLQTTPFVKLPQELRGLNDTIAALSRRNRQEVLFHEAWRQPMLTPESAPAIIISGGELFGEDRALGGTLALGASRYLHLKSNLWMAEFAENYGQGDLGWPSIPTPPLKNSEEIHDTQINLNAGQTTELGDDPWQQYEIIDSTYQNILNKPYVVTNLATLNQDRRMRSGEVHYIDHPKIGIMVYVTPYELPEENPDQTIEPELIDPASGAATQGR